MSLNQVGPTWGWWFFQCSQTEAFLYSVCNGMIVHFLPNDGESGDRCVIVRKFDKVEP